MRPLVRFYINCHHFCTPFHSGHSCPLFSIPITRPNPGFPISPRTRASRLPQSDPFVSQVLAAVSLSRISHSMKFRKPDAHPKIFPSFFVGAGRRWGLFSSWPFLALNTCFHWKESSIGIEYLAYTPTVTPTHWWLQSCITSTQMWLWSFPLFSAPENSYQSSSL